MAPTIEECVGRESYVGKFIFLEAIEEKNSYYNGEYVCIHETPYALHCVKPEGGYGGHQVRSFYLTGDKAYRVISARYNQAALQCLINRLTDFANHVGEKTPQWIESVYWGAQNVARQLNQVLDDQRGLEHYVSTPPPAGMSPLGYVNNEAHTLVIDIPDSVKSVTLRCSGSVTVEGRAVTVKLM